MPSIMCSWGRPTGQCCPGPAPYPRLTPERHFGLVVSVHPPRGLQPVPDEEVIELYGGTQHIPLYQMSGFYGKVGARLPLPRRPARCTPGRSACTLVSQPSPQSHTALGSPGLEGLLSQCCFPRAPPSSSSWTSSRCQRWRCSPAWWTTSWATAWSLTRRTSTRM